jgi:hypothetical protein
MIKIECDACERELVKPGALLFSPPTKNNDCKKMHLCNVCYMDVLDKMDEIWSKSVDNDKKT